MPPFKSKSGDADFDRVFNGEEGMRQQLLDELMQISEEESKYKAGQAAIEEQLYSEASIQEIDRQKLLRRGKLITVRRHSRFVEFPLHRHNYVEFMYVVQGEITHVIDGKELTLYKGDLLMLNQYVEHAIHRAEFEDIGINFIALPEFFEIPLGMLQFDTSDCDPATLLPQSSKYSKSADLLRKSLLSHIWRVPSSKALSCKHEQLFDLLTLVSYDVGVKRYFAPN